MLTNICLSISINIIFLFFYGGVIVLPYICLQAAPMSIAMDLHDSAMYRTLARHCHGGTGHGSVMVPPSHSHISIAMQAHGRYAMKLALSWACQGLAMGSCNGLSRSPSACLGTAMGVHGTATGLPWPHGPSYGNPMGNIMKVPFFAVP